MAESPHLLRGQSRAGVHPSEWAIWQRLTFPFSGWARRPLDANKLCGECYCRWSYGHWFPRWCRACRHVASFPACTEKPEWVLARYREAKNILNEIQALAALPDDLSEAVDEWLTMVAMDDCTTLDTDCACNRRSVNRG